MDRPTYLWLAFDASEIGEMVDDGLPKGLILPFDWVRIVAWTGALTYCLAAWSGVVYGVVAALGYLDDPSM